MSFDIVDFATHYGYLAVFAGVGAEGVGVPLPGETVLVVAAVLAGSGRLNLVVVGVTAWAAAVICPQVGYFVGLAWGTRLLQWGPIARIYPPAHVARAQNFFNRLGWVAVMVGRFVAVLRIFAAPLAGMHRMPWWRYTVANAVGSLLWVGAICAIGALIGGNLARAEHLVATVGVVGIAVFVALALTGIAVVMVRRRRRRRTAATRLTVRRPSLQSADHGRMQGPETSRRRREQPRSAARRCVTAVEVMVIAVLIGLIVGILPVLTFNPNSEQLPTVPAERADAPMTAPLTTPAEAADAVGLRGLPEHVNQGASDSANACGPAAAATVIAYWRGGPDPNPVADVRALEAGQPADVEYGIFGTSPQRETRMLTAAGMRVGWGSGDASLRAWVAAGYPVIVLQDVGPSWHRLGLHWTVVYGYDSTDVFLTNWVDATGTVDRVSWTIFDQGWDDGILMRGSSVAERFLVALPPSH